MLSEIKKELAICLTMELLKMLQEFKLVVDQPQQGSFASGSRVSGILSVTADSPRKYTLIKVKLHGHASTCLEKFTHKYTSDMELVNTEVTVWDGQGELHGMLQCGQYSFPFEFTLPNWLPSSFQSHNGSVEYSVEGWIFTQGPGVPLVKKVQIPVTLSIPSPQLQTPVTSQKRQEIHCWYSSHPPGNVVLTVESPCNSYCVGEEISLTAKVENDTDCHVTIEAALVRTTTYYAEGECQESSQKLVNNHRRDTVQPRSTITWKPQGIRTDSSEQVTSIAAGIIRVNHSVEVAAKVAIPLAADKLVKTEIPLTIGNNLQKDISPELTSQPPPPYEVALIMPSLT